MVTYTSSGGSFALHNPIQYWGDYSYDSYGERGARLGSFNAMYHVAVMTESVFNGPLVAWLFKQEGDTVSLVDEARVAQPPTAADDWDREPTDGIWAFDEEHMIYVANLGWNTGPWMVLLKRDGDSIYWNSATQLDEVGGVEYAPIACTLDKDTAIVAFAGSSKFYIAEVDRYGDDIQYGIHNEESLEGTWPYRVPIELAALGPKKFLLLSQWDEATYDVEASIYTKGSWTWQRHSHFTVYAGELTEESFETGGGMTVVGDRALAIHSFLNVNSGVYTWTIEGISFSISDDIIKDVEIQTLHTYQSTSASRDIYGLWAHGWGDGTITATWYIISDSTGNYTWHMLDASVDELGAPVVVEGSDYFTNSIYGINDAFAPNITGVQDAGVTVWSDLLSSYVAVLRVPEEGAPCIQVPELIDVDGAPNLTSSLEEEV